MSRVWERLAIAALCLRVARLSDQQQFEPWSFTALGIGFAIAWLVGLQRAKEAR